MSDRDAFREARDAAKAKLHEKRLEAATYTAAEVKVLTETASKVAYELGRKDAGEEIALALDARAVEWETPWPAPVEWDSHHMIVRDACQRAMKNAAKIARDLTSQPSGDESDERSGGSA